MVLDLNCLFLNSRKCKFYIEKLKGIVWLRRKPTVVWCIKTPDLFSVVMVTKSVGLLMPFIKQECVQPFILFINNEKFICYMLNNAFDQWIVGSDVFCVIFAQILTVDKCHSLVYDDVM